VGIASPACSAGQSPLSRGPEVASVAPSQPSAPGDTLTLGRIALSRSQYDQAERHFLSAIDGSASREGLLGLSEVELMTGRYQAAAEHAAQAVAGAEPAHRALVVEVQALRAQGKLGEAAARLRPVVAQPEYRRARLLLGELLLEIGRQQEAEAVLLTLVADYNEDRIRELDGPGLALVGRAAHLLRSPPDANDAFDQAERAGQSDAQTLLWRAELFLEAHDPGHAEEVLRELLSKAPHHPEALARLAQVKVAQTYDFQAATDLVERALRVDSQLWLGRFVLAGIALRDMELERAEQEINAGLASNPRQLELLSLRATVRFLAGDQAGFERATRAVLALHPRYSRMYQIIGEYAEWEHRYDEISELMRKAVRLDPEDGRAYAELGLNLIRAGDDRAGVRELRLAFARDPFDVRVFNTLNLYEKIIPDQYTTVRRGRFTIRYQKDQQAVLDRYVPEWLERAYGLYRKHYDFAPASTVGAELYAEHDHFSVRTSGLPNVGIQGVSFGHTFAALTPSAESFNLGMTLWHELAHVFHIQLARFRIPRWFTEGLAEYETMLARPEWQREHDLELYRALKTERIPSIQQMNRVFTHARDMEDMTLAYYASSQIVVMLGEQYGMPGLTRMMKLWAQGRPTAEVLRTALGVGPEEVDQAFRAWVEKRLSRYRAHYLPPVPPRSVARARAQALAQSGSAKARAAYGLGLLAAGKLVRAKSVMQQARQLNADEPDVLWLRAELAQVRRDFLEAEVALRELVAAGHDGYPVQMALGTVQAERSDSVAARDALQAAHRLDPTQAEPLVGMAEIARQIGDPAAELTALRALAGLDQHNADVYRRLLRSLVERELTAEAIRVGQAALYLDVLGLETHLLLAQALQREHQAKQARFELESAVLCHGEPKLKAEAHVRLARSYLQAGQRQRAREQLAQARRLQPDHPGLRELKP
ncbi:tetratricopeptide repeat protein, partial [Myxococcota bacterium]